MRTAEEMIAYIDENDLGRGMTKKWRLRHFKLAEKQLKDHEEVLTCFIGMHNFTKASDHGGYWAYVITNERFIMTQKKVVGENVQVVLRKHLNDVTKTTGVMFGRLTFDTIKETFNVGVDKKTIDSIYNDVSRVLFEEVKEEKSTIEQLKEYKDLLDLEIISQEEFDKKKAELL